MTKATSGHISGKAGLLTGYMGTNAFKKILFRADYVNSFTGQSKQLAEDLSAAMAELGRITRTVSGRP